jgi:hypothetical protein
MSTSVPVKADDHVTASFAGGAQTDYVDLASEATARINTLPTMKVAILPSTLDLRTTTGLVTVLLAATDDLRQWQVSDVRALGAAAVSTAPTADGKAIAATFKRADLAYLPAGDSVFVTFTGKFVNAGTQDEFVASTSVRVIK